jgi:LPXTG-motif cell wall-anchored protein
MTMTTGRVLKGSCLALTIGGLLFAQKQMPKTTTEKIHNSTTASTHSLTGTVQYVEGNTLVVKMAGGDIRSFTPPDSRKFMIDGQELTVHDLKPGTRLHAQVTNTQTSVTDRTTTVGEGKVWYVAGPNVILTLPNGENRQYKVKDDYRFMVDGKKATVFELRKGMVVKAEKIVETPRVELAQDVAVTGTAPKPKAEVAAAAPAPTPTPAPAMKRVAKAEPAPAPAPEPAAPAPEPAATPTKLPKTGSPLPLMGLAGLGFAAASMLMRRFR